MKKSRLMALVMTSLMVFGTMFTGCGNNNNGKTINETKKEEAKVEQKENNKKKVEEKVEEKTAYNGPKVLDYYLADEPETLDCQAMSGAPDMLVANMFIEGLARFGKEEGKYIPGAAKAWNYDESSNTYTFDLRDDAKWQDGTPVTADDFIFAWKLALDNVDSYTFMLTDYIEGAAEYSALSRKAYLVEKDAEFKALVEKAKAEKDKDKKKELNSQIGDRTGNLTEEEKAEFNQMKEELWANVGVKSESGKLSVTLKNPCAYFVGLTAFAVYYPMNEKFYNEHLNDPDNGYTLEAGGLYANGPWKVEEWKHNEGFKLVKNENYWNKDNINIDEINIRIVNDISTRTNLLKTGELDGSAIQAADLKEFEDLATLNQYNLQPMVNRSDYTIFYLEFNHFSNSITQNANIRKAMAYALDRNSFVEKINLGDDPALGVIPNVFPGLDKSFREENGKEMFPDNQKDKAKEFLAKGLEELGMDELPPLDMLCGTSDITMKISQKFQEDWKEAGITVNLVPVTWGEKLKRLHNGDFGLCASGWGPDYMDPMTFLDLFETPNGNNHGKYSNPEYDKLIEAARAEKNAEKRMAYLYEAEKLLIDDMVVAPQYFRVAHWTYKKYLTGIINRGAGPSVDFYWADLDMEAKMKDK